MICVLLLGVLTVLCVKPYGVLSTAHNHKTKLHGGHLQLRRILRGAGGWVTAWRAHPLVAGLGRATGRGRETGVWPSTEGVGWAVAIVQARWRGRSTAKRSREAHAAYFQTCVL